MSPGGVYTSSPISSPGARTAAERQARYRLQVVVGKQMMVDPTHAEEATASARVIIAMDVQRQKVAHVDIDGALDARQLRDAMGLGLSACAACEPELRQAIVQSRLVGDMTSKPSTGT
jgi:exosome complex RNA-binding protein Rrp42 (RNase PH superfamily)